MTDEAERLREETGAVLATVACALLWITTFVRVLAILVPPGSRPSVRAHPLRD